MSDERRKHVIPGEVITSRPMRPEENVVFDGKNISSTIVGTSEIYDDAVRVLPLTGMYFPKVEYGGRKGNLASSLSWEVMLCRIPTCKQYLDVISQPALINV